MFFVFESMFFGEGPPTPNPQPNPALLLSRLRPYEPRVKGVRWAGYGRFAVDRCMSVTRVRRRFMELLIDFPVSEKYMPHIALRSRAKNVRMRYRVCVFCLLFILLLGSLRSASPCSVSVPIVNAVQLQIYIKKDTRHEDLNKNGLCCFVQHTHTHRGARRRAALLLSHETDVRRHVTLSF